MHWTTWCLIALIAYIALMPIITGVLRIGRRGEPTDIQHDEQGLPL